MTPEERKALSEYHQDIHAWAEFESEIEDARKYFKVGGWFDRFCNWLMRKAQRERKQVTEDKNEFLSKIEKSGR